MASILNNNTEPSCKMRQFLSVLDEKSRAIIWHLWQQGHADIDELSSAAGLPSHMDVLLRIKETINPTAVNFYERPALKFLTSQMDRMTGEIVHFQWWLDRDLFACDPAKPSLIDWFEGKDTVTLVLEVGEQLALDQVKIEYKNGMLIIKLPKA